MKNKTSRYLTVVLAIWMLIVSIPLTVFADLLNITVRPEMDEIVYVLAEDNTKRTEFEKHYYCSDGTFVAVTYPEAVHYQNEQGEWVDVDMRLASDNAAQAYESQSGNFKTTFSKPGTKSDASVMSAGAISANVPAVNMQSGDYSLSWSLTGTKPMSVSAGTYDLNAAVGSSNIILSASADTEVQVKGGIKTAQAAFSVSKIPVTDPDAFALPSASNQVIYEDIFGAAQNVSVRYSVSMNKIEEDILITAPTDITSFSMQVDCGALAPVLNDDNSVDFLDNAGQMVYHVSTPYLVDAAFAVSYDVAVTLTEQDGTCTITYTPDAEWMNAPEREYPIMLDPAVTTNDYTAAIMDTYVVRNDASGYYTSQFLCFNPIGQNERYAVLKIQNFPNIDPSMPIISAKLNVKSTTTQTSSAQVTLGTVQDGFNVLIGNYNALMPYLLDSQTIATTSLSMFMEFDITQSISDIYSGAIGNTFVLHCDTNGTSALVFPIHSMESTETAARPYLTITYGYNLPAGLAANDEITIKNVGSAGYLYPNSGLSGNNNLVLHASESTTNSSYRLMTLRQNATNGTYKIEYTPFSNSGGAYISANTTNQKVVMYNTTNVPSNIKQDWLIVPYSYNTFKIVLASDMRYVMTAVGATSSYISNPEAATEGYVSITQCTGEPTAIQRWKIYKDSEPINSVIVNSPPLDQDYYYLNNSSTGKFLEVSLNALHTVGFASGRVSDLGDNIKWIFTKLPDGYFTIQNEAVPGKLLTGTQLTSAVMNTSNGTISDNQKWAISLGTTTYTITNVGTGQILTDPSYINGTWRIVKCSDYVELGDFGFEDLTLAYGETGQVQMVSLTPYPDNPSGAINFISTTDFVYDAIDESIATVNQTTGVVNGVGRGTTQIVVTHKVTGIQQRFYVTVEKKAIIVLPGCLGSELFVGEGHTYFKEGAPIFSTEVLEVLNELNTNLSIEEVALLVGAYTLSTPIVGDGVIITTALVADFTNAFYDTLRCNDNGTSKHNIYTKKYIYMDKDSEMPYELPREFDEDEYTLTAGTGDVYYTLMDMLHSKTAITSKYSIELFSYDWRLSNGYSAERLDAFIEENDYDKVILIAHSMGGLVASGYLGMGTEQQQKVEQVYYMASPLLGLPEVANIWYNEDVSFVIGNIPIANVETIVEALTFIGNPIQNLICNYASVYETFPSEYYFQFTNNGYLSTQQDRIIGDPIITELSTYASTKDTLVSKFPGFKANLMSQAETFHDSTFISGVHVSNFVTSHYFHCISREKNANGEYVYNLMPNKYILRDYSAVGSILLSEDPVVQGDSFVLRSSATLADSYPASTVAYYGGHMTLISTSTIIEHWLNNLCATLEND